MILKKAAWLLPRLIFTLFTLGILFILGSSFMYVSALTSPACLPTPAERSGYQSVDLHTTGGIPIHGWWRAPENGAVIILLGGHGANRDNMLPEAALLTKNGYGTLLIDFRHCAGQKATLGAREIEELRAAVDFARGQTGVRRVAVLGFSVGGVVAIRGGARYSDIDAVISMGNYYNQRGEIGGSDQPIYTFSDALARGVGLMLWIETGTLPASVSPIDDLPSIAPRPVFLIYGADETGRVRAQAQFERAGEPKQLWIVPGVGHGGYLQANPFEFERRVISFLNASLKP